MIDCGDLSVPGHSGGDPGIFTFVFYLPENRTGAILFVNTGGHFDFGLISMRQIAKRLLDEGRSNMI